MVTIEPIRVEVVTETEAVRKAKAIALQVLADMIESGEDEPKPLRLLFAARAHGERRKRSGSYAALLRIGWSLKTHFSATAG